jgi:hypothetical protein
MQLLPLIIWVINTTAILALPRGNMPYKVWFGRKLPTDFLNYKESACRIRTALGAIGGEVNSNENGPSEENREDSLFINKEAEQEKAAKEMILSELTKRVAEHMRKQKENIVKRENAKALEYDIQEIVTL